MGPLPKLGLGSVRGRCVKVVQGLRQVVRNGLGLLGVSAPEAM